MTEVKIRVFGAFRSMSPSTHVAVAVEDGACVRDVKSALAQELSKRNPPDKVAALIATSVLANQSEVLNDDSPITKDAELAVLPPVCGG